MHYKTAEHSFNVDGVDKFLSQFDEADVTRSPADTLTLFDAPDNDHTKFITLQRFKD